MIPWEHLGDARIPGTPDKLSLYRRDGEFSLRLARVELMNSRMHESEEVLARAALPDDRRAQVGNVLIGGLGMGFTLRAALDRLPAGARVVVAELVPEVIDWNRNHMGHLAGAPLNDPRTDIRLADVAEILKHSRSCFDVILLDTDNGPEGTSAEANEWLYADAGIQASWESLKPGGVLAVWSAFPSSRFTERLRRNGFRVELINARARRSKSARHIIWLAFK